MATSTDRLVFAIVDAVLDDLGGRSGIDSMFDEIRDDEDIWDDLRATCCERVAMVLTSQGL